MSSVASRPLVVDADSVSFRPGTKIDQVVDTLTRQAAEAGNGQSFSAGNSTTDQLNHYFRWAEAAEPQLANVLALPDARALVRTETYWVLRTASPDTVRLTTLINDEYQARQKALEQLAAELRKQCKRWADGAAPLVVPDTNMFLDKDESIEQVDWAVPVGSSIDVRVVVPLVVIHELDRLKRQGNSTTARLAQTAIRWLATILPTESGRSERLSTGEHGATFEAYVHDGPARPGDADGVILDVCRRLPTIANLPLTLVTKDLGMSLRAGAAAVKVVYLEKQTGPSTVVRQD